eukprot:6183763-Prymnesium_polylepis.1
MAGLNFSDCDVAVQLHFALFRGSGGYLLKPPEMCFTPQESLLGCATSVRDVSARDSARSGRQHTMTSVRKDGQH